MVGVWTGLVTLVAYAVAMRTVWVRQLRGQSRGRGFDESLLTSAGVCFAAAYVLGFVLLEAHWSAGAGVVMMGCLGAALLLAVSVVVLRVRHALQVARRRREETGLNYRAMLPGWLVGLVTGFVVLGGSLFAVAYVGGFVNPFLGAYMRELYRTGDLNGFQGFELRLTKVIGWGTVVLFVAPILLGCLVGLRQRYRIERRDAEYLRVRDRLAATAADARTDSEQPPTQRYAGPQVAAPRLLPPGPVVWADPDLRPVQE